MTFDSLLASTILAQAGAVAPTDAAPVAAGATAAPAGAGTPPPKGGIDPMMIMMMLALGGFALMMWFSGRKDKKKKEEMFSKLQKGAKVTTIGGARGKVTEVTDTEVTVKFEDCSITFLRSAIQSVDEAVV